MQETVLRKGAEAELIETTFLDNKALLKKRIVKNYRVKKLDDSIRKERTKQEAILLHRAKEAGVRTPIIYQTDKKNSCLTMEFIQGSRLKDALNKKNFSGYCNTLGEQIAFLHSAGIIHGDLTTSNIIVNPKNTLVLIDFGLGFFSEKLEDKAVDLLNLKKTIEATHHPLMPKAWQEITSAYCKNSAIGFGEKVLSQLSEIEKRARYL